MKRFIVPRILISILVTFGTSCLVEGQSVPTNTNHSCGTPKEPLQKDATLEILIESLRSEDKRTRDRAVAFIMYRGPAAKEAVPALINNLETDHMIEQTLHALKAIGPNAAAAIPALFRSLTAYPDHPAASWTAAHALANIGAAAIPTLEKGTGSANLCERIWCHAAMAKIEGPESHHFQFISAAMLSNNNTASLVAIRALTMIGSDSKSVLPQIIEAMDKQATAKTDLAQLLAQMKKDASPAIPQLVVLLDHSNPMTRQTSAYALSEIGGSEVRPAVPGLIGMLTARERYVREMAAIALGKIGPAAGLSVWPLIGRLKDKDEDERIRAEAARALGEIAPTDASVLGALIAEMKDEIQSVRDTAAIVLAKNAPVTKEIINVFIGLSEDDRHGVNRACRTFFLRPDLDDKDLIPEQYRLHSGASDFVN
jgi:HEAT repeat protein